MDVYWDTSALAKIYLREGASQHALRLYAERGVVSSALLPLELCSAATRHFAEARLQPREWQRLLRRMEQQREEWSLVTVNAEVLARGEQLISTHRVRSLDAIHLASALLLAARQTAPLVFVTADRRQAEAATALGLTLEWLG